MNKKQVIYVTVCVLFAGALIYAAHFFQRVDRNELLKEADGVEGVYAQGNYLIYEKENTWKNFPFFFGNHIVLYSLEDKKEYWITDCLNPVGGIYVETTEDDKIYTRYWHGEGTSFIVYEVDLINGAKKNLGEIENDFVVNHGQIITSVSDAYEEENPESYNVKVLVKDIEKGTKRTFQTETEYVEMFTYRQYVFILGEDEEENLYFARYNCENGKMQTYSRDLENFAYYEYEGVKPWSEEDILYISEEGSLVSYNIRTKENTVIVQDGMEKIMYSKEMNNECLYVKDGQVYYALIKGGIYKTDIKTKETEKIVLWDKMKESGWKGSEMCIQFTNDYAVLSQWEEEDFVIYPLQ